MKVLVVGSGGREHALCWKLAGSPTLTRLYCAPGNAGIADVAECAPISTEDTAGLVAFARDNAIDLVVVGPEAPLVAGLADALEAAGIRVFGPSAAAAEMEGSKGYMKDFLARHDIPTARYRRFTDAAAARAYAREWGAPIVVKTDGLAAGKGVTVARTLDEAIQAIDDALERGRFGAAGAEVVIEEFLEGEEVSVFALCDGERGLLFGSAQDHKAVGDGDTGPNTGGMGAYTPAPVMTPELERRVLDEIIRPTVEGLRAEGRPFKGVLFAGLMVATTPTGPVPKTLEFNVRFGDPECQALMYRLDSDLLPILDAAARGRLTDMTASWRDETALCVVMAARGYPGDYLRGTEIRGLDRANAVPGATVFHAGTRRDEAGRVLATGGRVLGVTARGASARDARDAAYAAVDALDWPEGFCRRDIAWRAVDR